MRGLFHAHICMINKKEASNGTSPFDQTSNGNVQIV